MNQEIEQNHEPRYVWVMVTIAFVIVGMEFGACPGKIRFIRLALFDTHNCRRIPAILQAK